MVEIRQTEVYARWFSRLADVKARAAIASRIDRLARGNAGDVAAVGDGVSELRIHSGPGYRVYFIQRGQLLVILLCAGDKSTQKRDIAIAKRLAKDLAQ